MRILFVTQFTVSFTKGFFFGRLASSNQKQSRFNAGNENTGLSLDALELH